MPTTSRAHESQPIPGSIWRAEPHAIDAEGICKRCLLMGAAMRCRQCGRGLCQVCSVDHRKETCMEKDLQPIAVKPAQTQPAEPTPAETKLMQLAVAIAQREGFGIKGDIPTRLNNPGDLMFAKQHNATPVSITGKDGKVRKYASFPSLSDGWSALYAQIRLDAKRGETLAEFIAKYAPASDGNDPASYLSFVMKRMQTQNAGVKLAELIAA